MCAALIGWATATGAYAGTVYERSLVMWIDIDGRTHLKKTAPGAALDGRLARGVYWRDTEIFPKGSRVRMVVSQIESRKKACTADDRPFVARLFAPRHCLVPQFGSVNVLLPGEVEIPLRGMFIALTQHAALSVGTAKSATTVANITADPSGPAPKLPRPKTPQPWVLTLQVEPQGTTFPALADALAGKDAGAPAQCPEPCTVTDGTPMHLALLGGLSASASQRGQSFQAVLLDPVLVDSAVAIPQGTILQGVLAERVPPRRLYRPGSLNLVFTHLVLPNGSAIAIAASPVAAEVDSGTHMSMDSEGKFHAQGPGALRLLLDFGVTGGIAKVSDDATQLIIEAVSSTATDVSTAGVAKVAAMCATGIYLLTRHGRDVTLPPYTLMDVRLNRAVSLGNGPLAAKPAK